MAVVYYHSVKFYRRGINSYDICPSVYLSTFTNLRFLTIDAIFMKFGMYVYIGRE